MCARSGKRQRSLHQRKSQNNKQAMTLRVVRRARTAVRVLGFVQCLKVRMTQAVAHWRAPMCGSQM
jgi:hypothetical protein